MVTRPAEVYFSPNQLKIMKMLCAGYCAKEIAAELGIEESTVARRHRYHIYCKVAQSIGKRPGYMTQTRLLIWALCQGVVSLSELKVAIAKATIETRDISEQD